MKDDLFKKPNKLEELIRLKKERESAKKREHRAEQSIIEGSKRVERLELKEYLRPYQQKSVLQALSNFSNNRPTLDASSMGLGKTRMAISFLKTSNQDPVGNVLWLTAKNLIKPTLNQFQQLKVSAIPVDFHNFELISQAIKTPTIYITNYESLGSKKRGKPFTETNLNWKFLVIDEVTKLKGGASYSPTQIWLLTKELIEIHNPYKYFISGTPVENNPKELWAYLHLFDPQRFAKLYLFEDLFYSGFSNEKLYDLLRSYIIRNTYESTKTELPQINEEQIECPLEINSNIYQLYKTLKEEFLLWLQEQSTGTSITMILEQLLRMRQLLSSGETFTFKKKDPETQVQIEQTFKLEGPFPKLDLAEQKIFELTNDKEPVIVFSCFNQPLKSLKERLSFLNLNIQIINGETKNQAQIVEDFQQNKIQVLLINKLSGSHGLNLQKCADWPGGSSHIIHLDRWWNPAKEDQANARIIRMNTTQPCFITYLHCPSTVDDFMLKLINHKRSLQEQTDEILIDKEEIYNDLRNF